jgi:hypothetical protein
LAKSEGGQAIEFRVFPKGYCGEILFDRAFDPRLRKFIPVPLFGYKISSKLKAPGQ